MSKKKVAPQAAPQEMSPLEMHGQLMACEEQRNDALNKAVIANGRLVVAGQNVMALQQQVAAMQLKLDAFAKKPAKKRGKAKA